MGDILDIGSIVGAIELEDRLTPAVKMAAGQMLGLGRVADEMGEKIADAGDKAAKSGNLIVSAFKLAAGAGAAVVGAMTAIGGSIIGLASKGSRLVGIEDSFHNIAKAAGVAGDALVNRLTAALKGTVDQTDQMEALSKALSAGVKLTTKDMDTLGATARAMARATGGDAAGALDTLTAALTRGRDRALQTIGIRINSEEAERKYAESIGTTADKLSALGSLEAKRIAMLEAMATYVGKTGEAELSLGEMLTKARLAIENWFDDVAKAVARSPVLKETFQQVADAVARIFSPDLLQSGVDAVVGAVEMFARAVQLAIPIVESIAQRVKDFWNWLIALNEKYQITATVSKIALQAFEYLKKAVDFVRDAAAALVRTWSSMPEWLQKVATQAAISGAAFYAVGKAVDAAQSVFMESVRTVDTWINIVTNAAATSHMLIHAVDKLRTSSGLAATAIRGMGAVFGLLTRPVESLNTIFDVTWRTANNLADAQKAMSVAAYTARDAEIALYVAQQNANKASLAAAEAAITQKAANLTSAYSAEEVAKANFEAAVAARANEAAQAELAAVEGRGAIAANALSKAHEELAIAQAASARSAVIAAGGGLAAPFIIVTGIVVTLIGTIKLLTDSWEAAFTTVLPPLGLAYRAMQDVREQWAAATEEVRRARKELEATTKSYRDLANIGVGVTKGALQDATHAIAQWVRDRIKETKPLFLQFRGDIAKDFQFDDVKDSGIDFGKAMEGMVAGIRRGLQQAYPALDLFLRALEKVRENRDRLATMAAPPEAPPSVAGPAPTGVYGATAWIQPDTLRKIRDELDRIYKLSPSKQLAALKDLSKETGVSVEGIRDVGEAWSAAGEDIDRALDTDPLTTFRKEIRALQQDMAGVSASQNIGVMTAAWNGLSPALKANRDVAADMYERFIGVAGQVRTLTPDTKALIVTLNELASAQSETIETSKDWVAWLGEADKFMQSSEIRNFNIQLQATADVLGGDWTKLSTEELKGLDAQFQKLSDRARETGVELPASMRATGRAIHDALTTPVRNATEWFNQMATSMQLVIDRAKSFKEGITARVNVLLDAGSVDKANQAIDALVRAMSQRKLTSLIVGPNQLGFDTDELRRALADIEGAMAQAIRDGKAIPESWQKWSFEIARALTAVDGQLKNLATRELQLALMNPFGKPIDQAYEYEKAVREVEQRIALARSGGIAKRVLESRIARDREIEDVRMSGRYVGKAFDDMKAKITEYYAVVARREAWDEFSSHLSSLSSAFSDLAQIAGDSMADIARSIGTAISSLDLFVKSVRDIKTSWKDIGAAMTKNSETGKRDILGLVTGVIGFVGAIGSAISAAVQFGKALKDAFDPPNWKRAIDEIKRTWVGVGEISENVAQQIQKDQESIFKGMRNNRWAAEVYNLGKIIDDVGLSAKNFTSLLGQMRNAFSFVEQGLFTTAQATEVLDQSFMKFVEFLGGNVTPALKEIIALNDKFGTQSKAIADYIDKEANKAATALASVITTRGAVVEALAEAQKKVDELVKKGASSKEIAAARSEVEKLQKQLAALPFNAQSAEAYGSALLGIFARLTKDGASAIDVAKQLAPAVKSLESQLTGLGDAQRAPVIKALDEAKKKLADLLDKRDLTPLQLDELIESGKIDAELEAAYDAVMTLEQKLNGLPDLAGPAFDEIKSMVALATDEIAGPALQSIQDLGTALEGLNNSNILTPEMFAGITQQISATVEQLKAQGKTTDEIYPFIASSLQTIWELQQDYGYAVDDATQALLDQAEADGKVGETHRSVQEQMLRATQLMTDAIVFMAEQLGYTVPEGLETAAGAFSDFADDATDDVNRIPTEIDIKVTGKYTGPQLPGSEAPETPGGNSAPYMTGGFVKPIYASTGFFVPTGSDTVPAMLTKGEGVLSVGGMDRLGRLALDALNSGSPLRPSPANVAPGSTSGGGDYSRHLPDEVRAADVTIVIQALDAKTVKDVVERDVAPVLNDVWRRNARGTRTDAKKALGV